METTATPAPHREDRSIPMAKAQSAALPFAAVTLVQAALFVLMWGWEPLRVAETFLLPWYFFPIFLVGIVLHELVHGLAWMAGGQLPFAKMKFGFQWKTLTPFAHCTVAIPKAGYVFGTLMPLLLLGVMPFLISLINGNGWLFLFGVLFTFAACGDLLIVWLLRGVSWEALVEDHPENAGCYVHRTADDSEPA